MDIPFPLRSFSSPQVNSEGHAMDTVPSKTGIIITWIRFEFRRMQSGDCLFCWSSNQKFYITEKNNDVHYLLMALHPNGSASTYQVWILFKLSQDPDFPDGRTVGRRMGESQIYCSLIIYAAVSWCIRSEWRMFFCFLFWFLRIQLLKHSSLQLTKSSHVRCNNVIIR